MKQLKIVLISLVFLCISLKLAWAATWLDPALKWQTLETPHFLIHFYGAEVDTAKKLAPIAEETHDRLTRFLRIEPQQKTNVLLLDTVDYGNGSATVIPDPKITIYLTDWSSNLTPSKYEEWLGFVFLHEYTHILHFEIVEGAPQLLKLFLGNVIFPNGLQPWFFIEGLATYSETKHQKWGRGADPRWDMMLRMDVLEDQLKSLDQAANSTVRWPMGLLRYLYGVKFLTYLEETYGEERLVALCHVYGDFMYAGNIDGAYLFVYRKTLGQLWIDWLAAMRTKYLAQKQALGKLTEPLLLTNSGYYNLKPIWNTTGTKIYYERRGPDSYSAIRAKDIVSGQDQVVVEANVSSDNLSFNQSGELLFSQLDTFNNYYTYSDLYLLSSNQQKVTQLTHGMRAADAAFSPNASQIVFVENSLGTRTLRLMSRDGTELGLLVPRVDNVQYFSPAWSPDGKTIAVAKWLPGGQQKIYLIDLATRQEQPMLSANDGVVESNPCFSPAGDYLIFDADRDDMVNLFAYHLPSKRLYKITNVLGGALMPAISPDGRRLAYVSYSAKGYDLAWLDVESLKWQLVQPSSRAATSRLDQPRFQKKLGQSNTYKISDYNPWPSLLPKFWLPLSYSNENGSQTNIYLQGLDILGQQQYQVLAGYDFEIARPQYSLLYANDQFGPRITCQLSETAVPYGWGSQTLWLRENISSIAFSLYDNRVSKSWDRQAFSIGYAQTEVQNITSLAELTPQPSLGDIKGVFLSYNYDSSRQYVKSISPEDGLALTAKITANSKSLGSDYTYTNYSAKLSSYFKTVWPHTIVASELSAFYSQGDQLVQSNFSWQYLSLRGYPATNFLGNKGISLSTEYSFPLFYPEVGWFYGSTFFDKVWGTLFYEVGGATFGQIDQLGLKRSYGAELSLESLFLWGYYGLTLQLGYVKGLDVNGEEKIYFSFGM
ncbi:hypothetical protein COT42_02265 [Candidatus Saganbacteria bacterium CG08_land_8_20_14_0_20_45_16]|uniref:Bacterial surface antigen (D15) domain-containing protein n=1 Tax=Candidatus Saganbacteria bacterium CG08_land_8_20_14_0_20_45_16 TaxID=2014293 RepID=A0A2H0Y2F0_UNCSA|nr:MAG: hypothetical protein COT42_02265 [Candidatus Saganbacteria bacterium CG08_land_8_20_14_0_20_45_16]